MELFQVVVGVILGAVLTLLNFKYQYRHSVRKRINKSLFHLLEIRDYLGMIVFIQSDSYQRTLIKRLKYKLPNVEFTADDEEEIRAGSLMAYSFLDDGSQGVLDKYNSAVEDISESTPYLAYTLRRNHFLTKSLTLIDTLLEEDSPKDRAALIAPIQTLFYKELLESFDEGLKSLAFKSGVLNWWYVRQHVKRVNKETDSDFLVKLIDEYIEEVIVPTYKNFEGCSDIQSK